MASFRGKKIKNEKFEKKKKTITRWSNFCYTCDNNYNKKKAINLMLQRT